MERNNIHTQSLLTLMVAQTSRADLSANETKGVCVLPSRPRPACRSNRPDTYQRLPISSNISLANRSRSIHKGHITAAHKGQRNWGKFLGGIKTDGHGKYSFISGDWTMLVREPVYGFGSSVAISIQVVDALVITRTRQRNFMR